MSAPHRACRSKLAPAVSLTFRPHAWKRSQHRAAPENIDVGSAATGTLILNPLKSSMLSNCRLDKKVI